MRCYNIRLKRAGTLRRPVFYVVVVMKGTRVPAGYKEKLGVYQPSNLTDKIVFFNYSRLGFWLLKGALLSRRVGLLFGRLHSNKY